MLSGIKWGKIMYLGGAGKITESIYELIVLQGMFNSGIGT